MKPDPPGYLWSKYECFLISGSWDIPHLRNFHTKSVKIFAVSSTNVMDARTNEQTNGKVETIFLNIILWKLLVANKLKTRIFTQSALKPDRAFPSHHWCFTWNLIKIGQMASELFRFESMADDGPLLYYKAKLSLRAFDTGELKLLQRVICGNNKMM